MDLRPHHLFCLRFYRGHGYNEAFCRNMDHVLSRLNEGEEIRLVSGCDEVCFSCPHRNGDQCDEQEKVRLFDRKALELLEFRPGDILTFDEAKALQNALVFRPGRFSEICEGCEWQDLCAPLAAELRE